MKKQAYMNKLTTKKQMQIQTWWALVGARSKLRSKVNFFQFCVIFHASLTLHSNVEKNYKNVGSGTPNIAPYKANRKSVGPVDSVFLIIF